MTALLLVVLLSPGDASETVRPPHPLAPSIPLLSEEEYAKIDGIIERFIQYDIGKLKGPEGRKALADFDKLGSDAIFPLIDGFNRAANLQHSCPAVIIGRKLAKILGRSQDSDLLEFARENIGAGVTATRHLNVVKDLRVGCMLRKTAVLRSQATAALPGQGPLRSMSLPDLSTAAGKEKGKNLKLVIMEVDRRTGPQVLDTLASVAGGSDKEGQPLARALLIRNLSRLSADKLKARLQDERPEVRAAALGMIAMRKLPWGIALIERVNDQDANVSQAARRALVQLAGGTDHGPESSASASEREAAASRWREWWSRRGQ